MAHSIGKTIAELRKAKGLTQVELAKKLGVSDKAVSKWESDGGFPEITQFPVIASIFDVSIDYLPHRGRHLFGADADQRHARAFDLSHRK